MRGATRHYVLAAGGTGGHLLPAFALAQELIGRGHRVVLVTDARGAQIPGKPADLAAHVMPAGRLGGGRLKGGPIAWLRAALAILAGRRMARRLFRQLEPSAVVGFGGYPALPALLAARAAGIPSLIHEQNAVLGRVNRLLARGVDAIATAYGQVDRLSPDHAGKVHLVGNPVRPEVLALRDEPFPTYLEGGALRLLVTGGSQGASVLSQVVPQGLALLAPDLRGRVEVVQQCRAEDIDAVRQAYANSGITADLATYFENMAALLAQAHLFVGRAGASTIAELTAAGRPAILVPLPIATDDHQAANTRELVAAGGAHAIRQPDFTPEALARRIEAFVQPADALAAAAHAAWNCGHPNAVSDLADLVESFGATPMMDVIRVQPASAVTAPVGAAGAAA